MKQVDTISLHEIHKMAEHMYGTLVKADVDVDREVLVVDMNMHADGEAFLLENGSKLADLWGINLYPNKYGTDQFIEYTSMINIRPQQNNPSNEVLDKAVRKQIKAIVDNKVHE